MTMIGAKGGGDNGGKGGGGNGNGGKGGGSSSGCALPTPGPLPRLGAEGGMSYLVTGGWSHEVVGVTRDKVRAASLLRGGGFSFAGVPVLGFLGTCFSLLSRVVSDRSTNKFSFWGG